MGIVKQTAGFKGNTGDSAEKGGGCGGNYGVGVRCGEMVVRGFRR